MPRASRSKKTTAASPYAAEIQRLEAAVAELKAKVEGETTGWHKARDEDVGKFLFMRESKRVMFLARRDIDEQAYFRTSKNRDSFPDHQPFPQDRDSDCRLATRAEILASDWIPAE